MVDNLNKRDAYEEKYFNEGSQNMNMLVAPQTSWAMVLSIIGFEKKWEIYPELMGKNVTDIGWGFSTMIFEVAPSVKAYTHVDPIFAYDRKTFLKKERMRIDYRTRLIDNMRTDVSDEILKKRNENKAKQEDVLEGLKKWESYDFSKLGNVKFNDSLAQDIHGIGDDSQDMVFLDFVLDKLEGWWSKKEEILEALHNAYRITKPWGKIYGVHNKESSEDDIIDALNASEYDFDGKYKEWYMYFIIDKQQSDE